MKKLMICIGTRPEAIKLAPVILEARARGLTVQVLVSGQHREMLIPFLNFFGVVPDFNLEVMRPNQSLGDLTSAILVGAQKVFLQAQPDLVVVQGDTTTTLACALAAFYQKIPVAHVEAGLRTHDRYSPFPEEMNRKLVTQLATYFFAPTVLARDHLAAEGFTANVWVTGNTGIDGVRIASERIRAGANSESGVGGADGSSAGLGLTERSRQALANDKRLVVVTCHRRENHGEPLIRICRAIRELGSQVSDAHFVIPVHLNPNVQGVVREQLGSLPQVELLPPLDYQAFVPYLMHASVLLTDSGGVQEEAPFFKKPIFVMRESTERPEGITAGVAELVGSDTAKIVDRVKRALTDREYYGSFVKAVSPYGDGYAAKQILDVLTKR